MKNAKKLLALLLCAVLLVGASIAGTVAYLTSQDSVTNTFTVGKVAITLDELDTDNDKVTSDNVSYENNVIRDKANEYHLMPGSTYTKDPTVHVKNDSEDSYIFVEIDNQLKDIIDTITIEDQIVANDWTILEVGGNVYYKEWTQPDENTDGYTDLVVFENFKIINNVSNTDLATYEGKTISVTAYAIQMENTTDAETAWGILNP